MDLEDAVAANKKAEARHNIVQALNTVAFGHTEKLVRINPVGSGFESDDIKTVLSGQVLPDGVVLPKVEDPAHVKWLSGAIAQSLGQKGGSIRIIALIETALALVRLERICQADLRLDALIFGADDYAASVGAARSEENDEVFVARSLVVAHAKAFGLEAIDLVQINFSDEQKLVKESLFGFRLGFTGKQVIHPKQVEIVNRTFSPDAKQLEWAKKIVDAFAAHDAAGKGAFTLDGAMIDMPTVKNAEKLLKLGKACALIP